MNRQDEHNSLPEDAALRRLEAELARAMPLRAPQGLADRIHAATAHPLGGRPEVIGRIGWTASAMWRYAAAIGLVIFYAAAWMKPATMPTEIPDGEVALVQRIAAPPATDLDQNIDALAADVQALSTSWTGVAADSSYATANGDAIATELYELEQSLEADGT